MSQNTNISFANMFKILKFMQIIAKNYYFWRSINCSNRYGIVFEKTKCKKITSILLERIFLVLKQMSFFI